MSTRPLHCIYGARLGDVCRRGHWLVGGCLHTTPVPWGHEEAKGEMSRGLDAKPGGRGAVLAGRDSTPPSPPIIQPPPITQSPPITQPSSITQPPRPLNCIFFDTHKVVQELQSAGQFHSPLRPQSPMMLSSHDQGTVCSRQRV